ncbi:unnamed protein product, partial [Rotaria sp. Silwood2]
MAASSYQGINAHTGIIVLGNAGSGKSFLCNLIIGSELFKSAISVDAVTINTEYHSVKQDAKEIRIYNIPGLVEADQERIEKNKEEILKAFQDSPSAVVLFVWSNINGRVQTNDAIAFDALSQAIEFPHGSLMFVVNDIPVRREADYEAKFVVRIKDMLKEMPVTLKDIFFIDHMEPEETDKIKQTRSKLIAFIEAHE